MAGGSAQGASLVRRTLEVLGAFDDQHRRLSLTELAARAGLPLATTSRIARQLVEAGALERGDDGRYVVGRRLWDIGLLAPVQTDVRELAAPYLQDLQAATRATVHLAERDGDQALYLDRLSGRSSVPVVSRVGSRLPLHSTGVGKVLLAHAPIDVQEGVLRNLTRFTTYTITSPAVLRRQLQRIRRLGYATTTEEMTLGACSVAVPVSGPDGGTIAALGLVVTTFKNDRSRLVAALRVAAAGIEREMQRSRQAAPPP